MARPASKASKARVATSQSLTTSTKAAAGRHSPSGSRGGSTPNALTSTGTSALSTDFAEGNERHTATHHNTVLMDGSIAEEAPSPPLPRRKRPRVSATDDAVSAQRTPPGHQTRSPSASAITAGVETRSAARLQGSGSPRHPTRLSTGSEAEVFVEPPSPPSHTTPLNATPLRQLHGTPTSQLLSQVQEPAYTTHSAATVDSAHSLLGADLITTPATVARRAAAPAHPPAAPRFSGTPEGDDEGEVLGSLTRSSRRTRFESTASSTRSSTHDSAVQAILRANPPTTTRAVELKPGYHAPSPRSPLWAALDADDPAGGEEVEESMQLLLGNTQVSLFQEDEEEEEEAEARRSATRERRRLGGTGGGSGSRISLPAPGRSVNLLDEEGLHEEERQPLLFVGGEDDEQESAVALGSQFVSLTQEAAKQERAMDHQTALPRRRSRGHRVPSASTTSASAAAAGGVAGSVPSALLTTTPSPARRGSQQSRLRASHQASPFSQLQRDVAAAAGASLPRATSAAAAASSSPRASSAAAGAMVSQRELRRRADMLKWAERTRAFFHFIDSLPLHISNSPLKPAAAAVGVSGNKQQQQRRSRSQTIAAAHRPPQGSLHGSPKTVAASMSLVRRSQSAVATGSVGRQGSAAFEAAVMRVKQEVAATKKQRRSATTATARPSEQ